MDTLNIISWNIFGLKRNIPLLNMFCKNFKGIIALQEALLWPHDLAICDSIHEDFRTFSTSSMQVTDQIIAGRPKGGLSFLWHKSLDNMIKVMTYRSDRLLGLQVTVGNSKILIINVYMPWENNNNFDHYCMILGELHSIIHDSPADHICIIGDLNSHPHKTIL